jgi:hypothetical protein
MKTSMMFAHTPSRCLSVSKLQPISHESPGIFRPITKALTAASRRTADAQIRKIACAHWQIARELPNNSIIAIATIQG